MNKTIIGLLFILAGVAYGSLAIDDIYSHTLGYLVEHKWIRPPATEKINQTILGRKPTILVYSLISIGIGIYILWNRNL
jgi:hypothetical protein